MLCKDKIISIFCLVDDILKGIRHKEDTKMLVSDSELILTAVVAGVGFYGNPSSAMLFMKQYGFITQMLDKSRFNRRSQVSATNLIYPYFCKKGNGNEPTMEISGTGKQ